MTRNERKLYFKEKIREYESESLCSMLSQDIQKQYINWKYAIGQIGFWVIVGYRIAHRLHVKGLDFIGLFLQVAIYFLTSCEISRKAIIGPGFGLFHPMSIFIGPYVNIGKSFTVAGPGIVVGSNKDGTSIDDYPVIDDGVHVSTGGKIMGDVLIGQFVRVGPNAVVMRDVMDNNDVMAPVSRPISREQWRGKNKE